MSAAKKDFGALQTGRLSSAIAAATEEQETVLPKREPKYVSPVEVAARENSLRTQGVRGCKAPRITMAFTTDNYNYIRVVAAATGRTMTQLVNDIIEKSRAENPDLLEKAQALLDRL